MGEERRVRGRGERVRGREGECESEGKGRERESEGGRRGYMAQWLWDCKLLCCSVR